MPGATSVAVGAPQQTPALQPQNERRIPFRQATLERTQTLPQEAQTLTASQQPIIRTVEGDGYVHSIRLHVYAGQTANTALVVFAEDAPWAAINSPQFSDVNGDLINLRDGFELYLANLGMAQFRNGLPTASALYSATSGSGSTGGSFNFWLPMPVACNRSNLMGILGNQDRAQKYFLRTNYAASAIIYGTAPTTLGSMTVEKYYENYSVPLSQSPLGIPQDQFPPLYNVLHYLTSSVDQTAPAPGLQNHYVQRVGNTVRFYALVFRQGSGSTPRNAAQTVMASDTSPATIQVYVGSNLVFNETYNSRRNKMFLRYGFDWPDGCLIYENLHDNLPFAGAENGNDYWHTAGVANVQFGVTYPSGYTANAANSLTIITDDLVGI